MTITETPEQIESIKRLNRDLRTMAALMGPAAARGFVDAYYQIQGHRIAMGNQARAVAEAGEPAELVEWLSSQAQTLENQIKAALDNYTAAQPVGVWCRAQKGLGPVLSAGLLAHIDITRVNSAGQIWSFAGFNPEAVWLGGEKGKKVVYAIRGTTDRPLANQDVIDIAQRAGCCPKWLSRRIRRAATGEDIPFRNLPQTEDFDYVRATLKNVGVPLTFDHAKEALAKRPWNTRLKTLCWKIGESFVKVSNDEHALYGRLYKENKAVLEHMNEAGAFADAAAAALDAKRYGADTKARKFYEAGKLPPAHVHARAKRFAVKIFLSHLFEVMYRCHYHADPPAPYAVAHGGHKDVIPVPGPAVWAAQQSDAAD